MRGEILDDLARGEEAELGLPGVLDGLDGALGHCFVWKTGCTQYTV
jgi:hypothetical protein